MSEKQTKLPKLSKKFDYEAILSDVYRWIPLQCNLDQLDALITEIQVNFPHAKREITKNGDMEHKVRMLRRAVGYGLLDRERLVQLVSDCEESGQQWIMLYRPKGESLKTIRSKEEVASLLGVQNQTFPSFKWPEEDLVFSDLRADFQNQKDWQLKLYAHASYKRVIDNQDGEKVGNNRYRDWVEYERDDAYLVHVVRWRDSLGILEVRIDKEKSKGRMAEKDVRFRSVIDVLAPAFSIPSQLACSLKDTCLQMLSNRSKQAEVFRLGHIRVEAKGKGKTLFFPYDSTRSVDDDLGQSEALNAQIKNGGVPTEACVNFVVPPTMGKTKKAKLEVDNENAKENELRIIIGGKLWNEVSISSRITPQLLDHVITFLCRSNS